MFRKRRDRSESDDMEEHYGDEDHSPNIINGLVVSDSLKRLCLSNNYNYPYENNSNLASSMNSGMDLDSHEGTTDECSNSTDTNFDPQMFPFKQKFGNKVDFILDDMLRKTRKSAFLECVSSGASHFPASSMQLVLPSSVGPHPLTGSCLRLRDEMRTDDPIRNIECCHLGERSNMLAYGHDNNTRDDSRYAREYSHAEWFSGAAVATEPPYDQRSRNSSNNISDWTLSSTMDVDYGMVVNNDNYSAGGSTGCVSWEEEDGLDNGDANDDDIDDIIL
jgi:hypothetical protein